MKTQMRVSVRGRAMAALCFALPGISSMSMAADVFLTASDGFGESSFDSGLHWNEGNPPAAGNDYWTWGFWLRTPAAAGDFVFAGGSLRVEPGGRLLGKATGIQNLTVNHLIMDGGIFDQAGADSTTGVVLHFFGAMTVLNDSSLGALGGNASGTLNFETLDIHAGISGSAVLNVADTNSGQNRGVVRLRAANAFNGTLAVHQPSVISSATHRLLQLAHPDALRFATLSLRNDQQSPVSFAAEANTGVFRIASLDGRSPQALVDTAGNAVTLEIGGTDLDGSYSGALQGPGGIVKTGAGTLVFSTAAHAYTGGTEIRQGKVTYEGALIPDASTVTIASGAVLDLQHGETDVVRGLVLNGAEQPEGVYDASTSGGFITGSGKIEVSFSSGEPGDSQDVELTGSDGFGTSSLTGAGNWSNGEAPAEEYHYFTRAFTLRTPNTGGEFAFAGGPLTVETDGRLLGKVPAGAVQTLTIPNLILNGGQLYQADNLESTGVLVLQGNLVVQQDSVLGALGPGANDAANYQVLDIRSVIEGSGGILLAGANNGENSGVVRLSAANPYSGTITVREPGNGFIASATERLLQLNHREAVKNATLALVSNAPDGISFAAAANTGPFRIGGLTGTIYQRLADTSGAAVTVEIGGSGGSSTYDGGLDGPGALIKAGSGSLTFSLSNGYAGSTTVTGGTLVLKETGSLSDTATVTVAAGAVLQLDHEGTDVVGGLVLGGAVKGEGVYDASNSGGFITGSGRIEVVPVSAGGYAAFIGGFGLSEADQAPDADPDGDGIENLVEYALEGLNPTVANVLPGLEGGVLGFSKRTGASGVTYAIEVSTTLGAAPDPWTAVEASFEDAETISYTLPAGLPRLFARLRVALE